MIKNDLDNIKVPEDIDNTIDLAIDKIRKESIIKNNKRRVGNKIAMVASLVIIIGTSSIIVVKPAWAANLPIIGNLIQRDLIDVNSKYKDYIQAVGKTKSDQGIDITFESAVADSNVLNLSFVVKNNNESIENNITDAMLIPTSLKVNGKEVSTGAGGSHEAIDKNTIRVLKKINWDFDELPDKLNVDIEISEMYGKKGNWDVNFALDARQIKKDTYVEKLDKIIKVDEVEFKLDKVTMSPLTTKINYQAKYEDKDRYLNFLIFDENGVEVKNDGYGTKTNGLTKKIEGTGDYINNVNIEQLNIIPFYNKNSMQGNINMENKLPSVKIDISNYSPINLKINYDTSIDINNWIVDGNFLIVKYSYRYQDKVMSRGFSQNLYIESDGKDISNLDDFNRGDDEERDALYRKYNDKYLDSMEIVKIGDSKNIEIGCYDGSSIEILKEQSFTVTKK